MKDFIALIHRRITIGSSVFSGGEKGGKPESPVLFPQLSALLGASESAPPPKKSERVISSKIRTVFCI